MEKDISEPRSTTPTDTTNTEKMRETTPTSAGKKEEQPTAEDLVNRDADAKLERTPVAGDYFRVFSYSKPVDMLLLGLAISAAAASGITFPLLQVVFGTMVTNFTGYFMVPPTATEAEFRSTLNRNSLYMMALFLGKFFLGYISKFGFRLIGIRMSAAVRLHYLQCLFGQTIHVLDSMAPGAAAGTITATANTLQLGISEKLGTLTEYLATFIAATVIAFVWNWKLALATCSLILFIMISVSILLPLILNVTGKVNRAETKSAAIASEAFSSIRMVAACGAESQMAKRFAVWSDAARRHGQNLSPLMAGQFSIVFFAMYGAFALAFWFGTKLYTQHQIDSSGDVVIVLLSVMMMVMSMERISTPSVAISKAMVAACEFFTVIDAPQPDRGHLKAPDVSTAHNIEFKDVHFAYPSRPHVRVLDGLNLTVEAGKLTAIVGPSGSGKSTVVGLIERWYTLHDQHAIAKAVDPEKKKKEEEKRKKKEAKAKKNGGVVVDDSDDEDEDTSSSSNNEDSGPLVELSGSISIDGHQLDEINLKWWRGQIGLVQQEPFLFNDTIYRNVAHGLIGTEFETASEERKLELVKEACKESFADEFIDRLPDGYNTMVGDSGTKLSGGQRQRISIARAVIKKPQILILDEATSAIDVRGERIVQAALDKVSQGRTTITIAHRLSTIKKADRILVMRKGQLVEQGTHDSLLQDPSGVYYGLVNAQQLSLGDPAEAAGADDENSDEELAAVLSREKSAAKTDGLESDADSPDGATKKGWENKGLFGSFGRLLYEQRSRFPLYATTFFFAGLAGAAGPLQAFLFAKVINVFVLSPEDPQTMERAQFWALMWTALAVSTGIGYFGMGYASTHVAHYISSKYRQQYFEGILHQKTEFFDSEENSTGTLTSRVSGDPKQLEEMLGINMAMVITSFFTLIGALIIAYYFGWKLALVATFVTMPLGLLAGYFRLRYELEFEKLYAAVFAESSQFAAEAIGAFRTVTSLTLEDPICERYDRLLQGHLWEAARKARLSTFISAFADSSVLGCQALIFWYGGTLLASREYTIIQFFVCMMAVIQGAEGAGQGFSFGPNAAQAAAAANRILKIRESRRDNDDDDDDSSSSTTPATIPDTEGGIKIELQGVHFKYPTRDMSIFKGLDLTIERGQFAALVGASGCGKTSIVSLLERFYEPQAGRILANGVDINGPQMPVSSYRKHLSLVAQEASLFQGTLRENILLGAASAASSSSSSSSGQQHIITEERLHAACREASIHDFITSLPEGYDTAIGSRGVSLSGGQKQRIAIARALIREPRLLLLDEATSSLDSESEKLVQAAFERAAKGRTMVAVAHRLATVQNADVIFVLGEGQVLEKGSHGELLRRKGVYYNMCQSQALDR